MHFDVSEEQQLIIDTTRAFVENELYPHEAVVEKTGHLDVEVVREIQAKAIDAGLYAANIPEEFGGAGLDTLSWLLYEKELGKANYALHWTGVARPSNILCAGTAEQREKYLEPCVRGEKWDCMAMTEPGAGSDLRGMKASARQDGDDWIINGTKHFISHADIADFTIVYVATGEEETPRGKKKLITSFFVDKGTPVTRCARATVMSRIAATPIRYSSLITAAYQHATCWVNCIKVLKWPTIGSAQRVCRWPPPASGALSVRFSMHCYMPPSASSSVRKSANSRVSHSSSPIWPWK